MFEIILVSHGGLAAAMLETAQLIAGEREGVRAFGLMAGESVEAFGEEVTAAIAGSLERGDVLVLTDLQAGSPFNVTVGAMTVHSFRHITGVNLALLIEALSAREYMTLEEACGELLEVGKAGVADINAYLEALEAADR